MSLTRRQWLAAAAAAAAGLGGRVQRAAAQAPTIRSRRNPGCGCCVEWTRHLEELGFEVQMAEDANLNAYKNALGVPADLRSCHTGVVDGYVIEGHVPGDVIQRMLKEKPAIAGLAVAGMPIGSPGMEGPNGKPFDVVAFTKQGERSVFARWTPR